MLRCGAFVVRLLLLSQTACAGYDTLMPYAGASSLTATRMRALRDLGLVANS